MKEFNLTDSERETMHRHNRQRTEQARDKAERALQPQLGSPGDRHDSISGARNSGYTNNPKTDK